MIFLLYYCCRRFKEKGTFDNKDSDIFYNPTRKVLLNEELAEIQAKGENFFMKSKKNICLVLVILMIILTFNINSYSVTEPRFGISSYNYSKGDKMTKKETKKVEIGKTLQLYALKKYGRDFEENPKDLGIFVSDANLSGVTWTSNNKEVATVDNTGKVTGVAEGDATIIAEYKGIRDTYEVNVIEKTILSKIGENQIILVLLISSITIVTFTYMGYKKYKK